MNPQAGGGRHSADDLRRRFAPVAAIEECAPDRLAEAVGRAVEGGAAFVGVAGGDGTIRGGVEALRGHQVPLVPVPAGTRNHFARQLGISDFDAAKVAMSDRSGRVEAVDVGEVNGRSFINNAALGLYPELVDRRERFQKRGLPKGLAQQIANLIVLARGHRLTVRMDGVAYRTWLVFVGNGHYGDNLFDLTSRDTLNQHVLDVRLLRGDRRLARLRVLGAALFGRLTCSPLLVRELCSEVTFDLDGGQVEVALDGEVTTLASPLHYCSRAGELRVLIPGDEQSPKPHVLRLSGLNGDHFTG
ncbi:MAG: diacylglycerol/lipid kinase family protein [Acidimicrobiales bacterium]